MVFGRITFSVVLGLTLSSADAIGGCPPGKTRDCVDLNVIPQITNQIAADEKLASPAKKYAPEASTQSYTGPTVGFSKMIRQAPTVGYRWSID